MDKRIFGIKISTYLTVLGSVALAIAVWAIVKMLPETQSAYAFFG